MSSTGTLFSSPGAAKLLLVGDDLLASLAPERLAPLFGRIPVLRVAANGREALDVLKRERFDAVVAELASLADLREPAETAITRIARVSAGALLVAVSAGGSVSAAVGIMRAGAHDCVARPIAPETLAQRIAALARQLGKVQLQPVETLVSKPPVMPPMLPGPQVLPMWRQEQRIIEDAISSFAGNVALAAAALEISPSTIYRKRQMWAEGKRGA